MSWGILRKHLITGTFICCLALLTAQWAATQTRFNVQSSGRGLQNAKMGAQINQLQAENDAQQAELDAKKPHADATLATCGVGSGTVNNKITWNAGTNTWGCIEETDPNVQEFAKDGYTAPATCAGGQILTMENKKLKCTASGGTGGFEVDPTVFDFTHNTYSLPSCAASQVLTLKTVSGKQRLGCVSGSALSNFEVDPTVKAFAKKNLPTCGAGKILTSDGTDFVCVNDGEGVTMEVDPTVKSFAKNNLPNCTGNQVLKANGSVFSCVSAVAQSAGNNAGTVDGLNSTQFLRSDANDTATGILTLNNQVRINSYLMQEQGGSYDVWLQGNSAATGAGNARNLALLGLKSTDKLYVNYQSEYQGGTVIGGPAIVAGGNLEVINGSILASGKVDAAQIFTDDIANARWCQAAEGGRIYCTKSQPVMSESDPKVGTVSNGKWCVASGGKVVCNTNAPVTSESDPQVGGLTGNKWCASNAAGTAVVCNKNQPVLSETDPKVGSLTNGKWCRASGGKVVCNQDPPVSSTLGCVLQCRIWELGTGWGAWNTQCAHSHHGTINEFKIELRCN